MLIGSMCISLEKNAKPAYTTLRFSGYIQINGIEYFYFPVNKHLGTFDET